MPHHESPSRQRNFARSMRRDPTKAEAILWQQLKGRQIGGFKFRRQVPVRGYILDFVSFEAKLIIEVDGFQHAESIGDKARDTVFAEDGFRTLRFWNEEIEESLDFVIRKVLMELGRPF